MTSKRSKLMLGCGCAAIALSMAMASQRARAQGIQATPNVTQGSATIDRSVLGQDTIAADTPTVVIDWTPDQDNLGNALDFLPTGNTAIFQNGVNIPSTDFSVLNRILPSSNGNIAVIDGTVISRIFDANGSSTPGGFVAFYSPTGLLIGNNAVFDVGSLMLTTLDPNPTGFGTFASGGAQLGLVGQTGTTAPIVINPGAQIGATAENSFFVVAAAEIQMLGTARINGSHAYVAGEVVNLTFNNGLFDIQVPVGTQVAQPITIDGTVGGPSSTGAGDDHMIYAVARAQIDPISMFFRGNLGFDPAANASIVNGEIILSANYNVGGRQVAGGTISFGIGATFPEVDAFGAPPIQADITLENISSTSSILAISTHNTTSSTLFGTTSVDGDLLLVGRQSAELTSGLDSLVDITGDVLVSARAFGVTGTSFNNPNVINAQGGLARILASTGGIFIGGDALVTTDARAGADNGALAAGAASGGTSEIEAFGGTINITGGATISARAIGSVEPFLITGEDSDGGVARLLSHDDGFVSIGQNLILAADAIGADTETNNPSTGSSAFGGLAQIEVFNNGTLSTTGNLSMKAGAIAGDSNQTGQGALADSGEATILIDGIGSTALFGAMSLATDAVGGDNVGGQGGDALGGISRVDVVNAGGLIAAGNFSALAKAFGGNGDGGGDAQGGAAGLRIVDATGDIQGTITADANANGGSATFGFGGNGGNGLGGAAFVQVEASLTTSASLDIASGASVTANGTGGVGGAGDGSATTAGRGGDGTGGNPGAINQADPTFASGAYFLVDGDNGVLTIGGKASMGTDGIGGDGGSGGVGQAGGDGGTGTGGEAAAGLVIFGGDGSLGQGSAGFADIQIDAIGTGGFGGLGGATGDPRGFGGSGVGGNIFLEAAAGDLSAGLVRLFAVGYGSDGFDGGDGIGGSAGAGGSLQGTFTMDSFGALAVGFGGAGDSAGGNGSGGSAFVDLDDADFQINGNINLDASGNGGDSPGPDGAGNGTGGTALLVGNAAQIGLQGSNRIIADAFGGAGATGGNANSGFAGVDLTNSGISIVAGTQPGTLLVSSQANGGDGSLQLGNAISDTAELRMLDSSIDADAIMIKAQAAYSLLPATGSTPALARAGTARAIIDGNSSIDVAAFDLLASAFTVIGGSAEGGLASLSLGTSGAPEVIVTDLTMEANASGSAPDALAADDGRFEVLVDAGGILATNFNASATGDLTNNPQSPSSISATGGDFVIAASGVIDVTGDLAITAGAGHFVGDTGTSPSNDISATAQGTITITGDDDNVIDFGALTMELSAREIDILPGARIAASTMTFTSLDTDNTAIIGGPNDEAGFTLTQDEAARIDVGDFTIVGPEISSSDPSLPDILLRDLTILGSASPNGGVSRFAILADPSAGLVRIEGMVDYFNAAPDDTFLIQAGDRIEVVTPGGIRLVDSDDLPSGRLILEAFDIWAADAGLIDQLQSDPQFSGRDSDLAVAFAGSDDPLGYLIGGSVQFGVTGSLLVRNTGSDIEQGGITVGAGGLQIFSPDPQILLDAFAYGRRERDDGTFVTGEAFFNEVNFNLTGTGATLYTDIAAFNDCIINTGECPVVVTPVSPTDENETTITNPIVTVTPVGAPEIITATRGESNRAFGGDFPGLIEAPLLSEDPLLEDPVASGGDTTLYGQDDAAKEDGDEQ